MKVYFQLVLLISVLTISFLGILIFYNSNFHPINNGISSYQNNKQDALQSVTVESQSCKMPKLTIDDPTIKQYLEKLKPLRCEPSKNLVYTRDGQIFINPDVARQYNGSLTCVMAEVQRMTDNNNHIGDMIKIINGSKVVGDVMEVVCSTGSKKNQTTKYKNLHITVVVNDTLQANLLKRRDVFQKSASHALDLNVYIYVMDSLSRINFMRQLPEFYSFLKNDLGAVVMEGLNIMGDSTPRTMIPVTTGHFQTELPEARKRLGNRANYVDRWPFVFKNFSNAGYATAFTEEEADFTFLNYKLKGFDRKPVDHYLRPYQIEIQNDNYFENYHSKYCLGDTPRSVTLCKWWSELYKNYNQKNIRTFALLHESEMTHDDYNLGQVIDTHLKNIFLEQNKKGFFNNTMLVVMGDHGHRIAKVRQTQSGRIEEKLPFFSISLPPWFKRKHPQAWQNLIDNSQRLVNPFDIHTTLMAVLNFTDEKFVRPYPRAMSLFQKIPIDRTCEDAQIKPHFCACLDWTEISAKSPECWKIGEFVVDKFNELNQIATNSCMPLSLDYIEVARKMTPLPSMLSFKQSADYDGFYPDLTADPAVSYEFYDLKFKTQPNLAWYEVSVIVVGNATAQNFVFSFDDVSRIDKYGDQPRCIISIYEHLRKFCYCHDYHEEIRNQ